MSVGSGREAPSDPAVVGRAVRPHGLAGEIVVAPVESSSAECTPGSEMWLAGRWRRVAKARTDNKGRWVVKFEDVPDRDAAEKLRGEELSIEAAELPALVDGLYYIHDLVGCRVVDPDGAAIGVVIGVVSGPQDWLEVEHDAHRSLVPMVPAIVKEVDVHEQRIVIDLPQGLVDATRH